MRSIHPEKSWIVWIVLNLKAQNESMIFFWLSSSWLPFKKVDQLANMSFILLPWIFLIDQSLANSASNPIHNHIFHHLIWLTWHPFDHTDQVWLTESLINSIFADSPKYVLSVAQSTWSPQISNLINTHPSRWLTLASDCLDMIR